MLNQVVLVGRLTENPTFKEEGEKKRTTITLAVQRSYKNTDGIYETDFVPCILWNGIAERTTEYCKKGDVVGVKGRIQTIEGKIEIIAEKVTFLSSNPTKEPAEDNE